MNKKFLLAALGMSLFADSSLQKGQRKINITSERYAVIPKGCQVYEQDGIKLYALNEASAKRKFEKIRKAKENQK